MSENSTLQIHTNFRPEDAQVVRPRRARHRAKRRGGRSAPIAVEGARRGFSDRLLRNSAIACAFLLGVLALGNVRQPWAEKAAEGIRQALSMHIDLDDSIGELTFVRQLMPESALVFLNVSGGAELAMPAEGEVAHAWSALQPWLMLSAEGAEVRAAATGTVTAVSALSGGGYGLLIDHGQGLESVYAGVEAPAVQSGDSVQRGQPLGTCDGSLYFELRQDGEAVDPTQQLGL